MWDNHKITKRIMKDLTLKLFPYLISLVFVFPILKENLSSFTLILLTLNLIVYKFATKDTTFVNKKILILTIPFWIICLNALMSSNIKESSIHIQHALFFLLIPIVFSLIPKQFFTLKKINLYISVLKNTCLLIAFVYVFYYLINVPSWKFDVVYQNVSSFRNYIYNDFKFFVIHPTYYTTILILCSAHSLNLVLKENKKQELLYLLVFMVITFLLLTKLNIFIMICVLSGMVLFRGNIKTSQRIIIATISLFFVGMLAFFTPGIEQRFEELYKSFSTKPQDLAYDSTNIRKAIFDSSVIIAKENWIKGVGFENLQEELNKSYKKNYNSSFYESHNYMTHNYYFYIFLSTGIIGFMFYLFYLKSIVTIAIKSNLFLFRILLLNALLICFVEDYFYRQFGILYFNLLTMCFIRYSENVATENEKIQV